MSDTEKMNEAMYERLGEIVFKAAYTRTICNSASGADEKNVQLLAAFRELRQMCEFYKQAAEPIVPGCPSLMPRQLPGGFDDVEEIREDSPDSRSEAEHDKFHRKHWTFCDGLFPIAFVNTPEGFMAKCTINGRRFKESVIQEDVACEDVKNWNGYIYDNGKCVCMVLGMGKGKNCVKEMTHCAFRAYVKQLSGPGKKYHNSKGFLRKAAAKQQAQALRREPET